ncbi:1012_t:CDS:2 [Entrophospora sp. SA101]|nr:1012_t:CDS:2 [Entrophospora sp. SA101]
MQFKFDEHPAAADFEKKCENEFSQNLVTVTQNIQLNLEMRKY